MIKRIFKYIEPLWLGAYGKVSIRRVLAIAFSINMISNVDFIVRNWEEGRSYIDVSTLIMIEAGLIAALLALTTYSNVTKTKLTHGRSDYAESGGASAPFD